MNSDFRVATNVLLVLQFVVLPLTAHSAMDVPTSTGIVYRAVRHGAGLESYTNTNMATKVSLRLVNTGTKVLGFDRRLFCEMVCLRVIDRDGKQVPGPLWDIFGELTLSNLVTIAPKESWTVELDLTRAVCDTNQLETVLRDGGKTVIVYDIRYARNTIPVDIERILWRGRIEAELSLNDIVTVTIDEQAKGKEKGD